MKAVIAGGIIAAIIAIIVIVGFSISDSDTKMDEWISSGPFSINKQQYLLGENIFFIAEGIQPHEKGEIQFTRPSGDIYRTIGDIYRTIPFDGSQRSTFNQYFTPFLSPALKVCTSDDLVGLWTIKFQGTNYKSITFEMKNEYLEGEEWKFVDDC